MTPLQKIAIGMVIVLVPAYFPAHPHPAWALYDAVPDPVGWCFVVVGVRALARSSKLDLSAVGWLSVLALVVSVPLWFPQVNHLLVPAYNSDISVSGQWFASLPQTLFGLVLSRQLSRAGQLAQPRDGYLAGRFGVLMWAFAASVALPAVAYGVPVAALQDPTLLLIGVVSIAFCYYLFMVNRRTDLGGPGPRVWAEQVRQRRRSD